MCHCVQTVRNLVRGRGKFIHMSLSSLCLGFLNVLTTDLGIRFSYVFQDDFFGFNFFLKTVRSQNVWAWCFRWILIHVLNQPHRSARRVWHALTSHR